jgi:hypothetical protein
VVRNGKFWFSIFSSFLVLLVAVQPIFAESKMDNTGIEIYDSDAVNITVEKDTLGYVIVYTFKDNFPHLHVSLVNYDGYDWLGHHYSLKQCWLDFNVYKVNSDGSNGMLFYHTRKKTGTFGGPINLGLYLLQGDYKLEMTYGGDRKCRLSPCNHTVKVRVLQPP